MAAGVMGLATMAVSGFIWLPAADAAPAIVTLVGSAPAAVGAPDPAQFQYTITAPSALANVTFETQQAAGMPVQAATVRVDGAAPGPGQVNAVAPVDVSVAIPTLTAGTHTITFAATVPTAPTNTSSAAKVTFEDAANPGSPSTVDAEAVPVAVNQPDLEVTVVGTRGGAVVPKAVSLGTGSRAGLQVTVVNHGYGDAAPQVTFTLPAAARIADSAWITDDSYDDSVCQPASGAVTCSLPRLPRDATALLFVDLTTSGTPPVGSTVPVTVTAGFTTPGVLDMNPADNSDDVQLTYAGIAHLATSVNPSSVRAKAGQTTSVTVSVKNDGPQQAPGTFAAICVEGVFEITGFDGAAPATAALMEAKAASSASKAFLDHRHPLISAVGPTAFSDDSSGGCVLWEIGDLAAGQSVTTHVNVRGTSEGTDHLVAFPFSAAGDPACDTADTNEDALRGGCGASAVLTATGTTSNTKTSTGKTSGTTSAVGTSATVTAAGSDQAVNAADPALAATGANPAPLAGIGVGMIGIGAAALAAASRRRQSTG
jgi:hypothetical protein